MRASTILAAIPAGTPEQMGEQTEQIPEQTEQIPEQSAMLGE